MNSIRRQIEALEQELKDSQGGLKPAGEALDRAEKADLLTLPKNVPGTNCGNCRFFSDGYCGHKEVDQPVTERMCCSFWDSEGCLRAWE